MQRRQPTNRCARLRRAAIVDPGDAAPVCAALATLGLEPCAILATHHHGDHTAGNIAFKGLTFTRGEREVITKSDIGLQHEWDMWNKANAMLRFRDVEQGPDGALYLLTDEENGKLLKLTPK